MAMVLVAAAVGVLGHGGLSRREAWAGDTNIEYQAIVRVRAPESYRLATKSNGDSRIRIGLSRALIDAISLEQVDPTPLEVARDSGFLWLTFAARPTTVISIEYQPRRWGRIEWLLTGPGAEQARIRQMVLP